MSWFLVLVAAWVALELLQRLLPKWGAKGVAKAAEPLAATSRRYERVDASTYGDLDLAWYETTTSRLVARGFVHLEDIIDADLARRRPSVRAFIRVLRSGDGATVCGLYHYRERGWLRFMLPKKLTDLHVCDLETELSNGSFLCTSNAPTTEAFDYGEQVASQRVDSQDIEQLLRTHELRLAERIDRQPTITAIRCQTADDVRSLADRLQRAKSTFRRSRSVPMTKDELNHVSDGRYAPEAAAIARELESSAKKESQ